MVLSSGVCVSEELFSEVGKVVLLLSAEPPQADIEKAISKLNKLNKNSFFTKFTSLLFLIIILLTPQTFKLSILYFS